MRKLALSAITAAAAALVCVLPVCAQPQDMGDGTLFDAVYYAQNNPDVVRIYGNDPQMLYLHYNTFGKAEGRAPYAVAATSAAPASATTANAASAGNTRTTPDTQSQFNAAFYASTYPDVAAVYGNDPVALYNHYLTLGYYEGRLGHAGAMKYIPESQYGKRVLEVVNQYRREGEMYDLNYSFELENAALIRAKELAKVFGNERPDGSAYSTVLPDWAKDKNHGELIAKNKATPEDVAYWWHDHRHDGAEMRKIMLDFHFTEGGAAYWVDPDTGTSYWVLLLGRRTHYKD